MLEINGPTDDGASDFPAQEGAVVSGRDGQGTADTPPRGKTKDEPGWAPLGLVNIGTVNGVPMWVRAYTPDPN
jgi:hypothetical protein